MEDFSLEAKMGLFKRRRLEMGMGNESRERHDFFIFIFMESLVWMRQGAYRSVQFLKDSNRHNTSCALIMRFHNFKNCWMNEFTHWFIHHLFSPLTYIRFGGAFLGVWVLDRQILTMKNFSFLKTLLPVCGIRSLPTQGGIRHPARLKVFHAHGFRVPGAPVNTPCFLHRKGAAWHTVMQGLAFVGYIWHCGKITLTLCDLVWETFSIPQPSFITEAVTIASYWGHCWRSGWKSKAKQVKFCLGLKLSAII